MERKKSQKSIIVFLVFSSFLFVGPLLANALVVSGNDNVGIGTANPTQALEVLGNIKFSGGVLMFPDGTTQSTATVQGPQGFPGNYNYTKTGFVGSGGTPPENGTALLNTLIGMTDASFEHPALLKIEPGIYDIGGEVLQMIPYVDIEGSGENTTIITGHPDGPGVVNGASNAEIRFLTVENTGGGNNAVAIGNNNASPKMTNVTAKASGGSGFVCGIYNYSSSPVMTNVTASGSGGTICSGVNNDNGSASFLTNVTASAKDGTSNNSGITNGNNSPATMKNVTATASGGSYSCGVCNYSSNVKMDSVSATASGSTTTNGVVNWDNSPATMINVTATASGGTDTNGVINYSSNAKMHNVIATASGGTNNNVGVSNDASAPLMRNVRAEGFGGTNSNGINNYNCSGPFVMAFVGAMAHDATNFNAAINNQSCSPTMTNIYVSAFPGLAGAHHNGIFNNASSPTIEAATILVPTGSGVCGGGCFGVFSITSGNVRIDNSQVSAFSNTLWNGNSVTTYAGSTKLQGGAAFNEGTGTLKCINVYNANYDSLSSGCQ